MKKMKKGSPGLKGARSRGRAAATETEVKTSLFDGRSLPLVIEPTVDDLDAAHWVRENRQMLEEKILEHGGVLLRGFSIDTLEQFEEVAKIIAPDLLDYVEGSSPRIMLTDKVYTSTEYPPEYFVSLHSELSYAHEWPAKIFFYCDVEPEQGGETPIADNREVLEALPEDLRRRFEERGTRYLRNLHGGAGAGLAWQTVFETDDKEFVERYCRDGEIDFQWTEDGGLRTRQERPAVIRHPKTGEALWFNQVDQWHPSNLDEGVAEALEKLADDGGLPIDAEHADGTPLSVEDLDTVRSTIREVMVAFPWKKRDLLVLDNMLAAHGRSPFSGKRRVVVTMGEPVRLSEVEASTR